MLYICGPHQTMTAGYYSYTCPPSACFFLRMQKGTLWVILHFISHILLLSLILLGHPSGPQILCPLVKPRQPFPSSSHSRNPMENSLCNTQAKGQLLSRSNPSPVQIVFFSNHLVGCFLKIGWNLSSRTELLFYKLLNSQHLE